MKTNDELKQIRKENNLSARQIAELLSCGHRTIQNWLQNETTKTYRKMPAAVLELLKIKLAQQRSNKKSKSEIKK